MDQFNRISPDAKLYFYSQFSCSAALFFWCWAGLNTISMTKGMDLGVISFATVILTSIYFLMKKGKNPTKFSRLCSVLSHLLVSSNYALGVLYALKIGPKPLYRFGTYCVIFTIIWLILAVYSWRLVTNVIIHEILEADESENLYSFGPKRIKSTRS